MGRTGGKGQFGYEGVQIRRAIGVWLVCVAIGIVAGPSPARADAGDPVGAFDSISVRLGFNSLQPQAPGSPWLIEGWAADPDAPDQPIDVHVYIDGQAVAVVRTGRPRPDVDAAVPFAGPNAGWALFVDAGDGAPHTVCTYAINAGAGTGNTTLGCRNYPIPGTSIADPQGSVDAITVTPGLVRFQGWAGDGDAPGPTPVRLIADGEAFDSFTPTIPRDDVRVASPGLQNAAGFDATLPMLPGTHLYCLIAGNDGPNGFNNTTLRCGRLDVPDVQAPANDEARGAFDALTLDYPNAQAHGWAWKPGASAPYAVRLRTLESRFDYFNRGMVYDGATNEPRPDVQQVYPQAPSDTGYTISVDNGGSVPRSIHYFCMYVLDGAAERLLGCKTGG